MATHLATTVTFARERFGGASFNTAPHSPPVFQDIAHQQSPDNAKRLSCLGGMPNIISVSRYVAIRSAPVASRFRTKCGAPCATHRTFAADT
jgi:hypothetical protein